MATLDELRPASPAATACNSASAPCSAAAWSTALRARAAERPVASPPQAKSCILIWMDGGPTHYETFDPKPDAPAEIRGEFKPIATKRRPASTSPST